MIAEWLLQNEQEIISVYEQGFYLWLSRSRGRARQGQCALRIVGARKGPHFSSILAVSNQRGVIHHMIHNGGTNIERFNLFMEETSVAAADNVQLTYLLVNASCHRRAAEAMIPGHHVARHLFAVFQHLRERLFGMEELAEARVGGSASTSCTAAS